MSSRSRNLLNNPKAKDGLDGWKIIHSGGDGFKVEDPPEGSTPINESTNIRANLPCWSTSYDVCEKVQIVDLLKQGISERNLDERKPLITVRDWYTPRFDCGCVYNITARLLAADGTTELDKWEFKETKDPGDDWAKARHVFKNYPTGVRFVEFKHGGKDTKYWAGHYGVKLTNSGVFVGKRRKSGQNNAIGKNLLKNPRARDGLNGWDIICEGGDGFDCEKPPAGCKPINQSTNIDANLPCWSTSYQPCEKGQVVDLIAEGIKERKLDKRKPKITIRDWYTPRFDCGCRYNLTVRLLAEDRETALDKWEFADVRDTGADWAKAYHVFKNYPSGVRFIDFKHGGQDTKNWAGHYGAKMTNSGVIVGKKRKFNGAARKNLLKNPRAKGGLNEWEIYSEGGDGFKCEAPPVGCKPISESTNIEENLPCWSTSYQLCEKGQLVDLIGQGIDERKLDQRKPNIVVRDWYVPRFDCGCKYNITVRLLAEDRKTVLDKWEFADVREAGADWAKARHVFKGYPIGVRFVEFKHGGQDTNNWAGNYGVKMTNSGVLVGKKWTSGETDVPIGKNLIKNPSGKDGLDGWEVTASGGNGFLVEEQAGSCKPIQEVNVDAKEGFCWATSFADCEKKQVIDLGSEGFDGDFMDEVQPEIRISEWFGVRSDAGCHYWLKVRLLNAVLEEIDSRTVTEERGACGDWFEVSESFSRYGAGVRFIEYSHGGRDNCFWKGHYGAKIACSTVEIGEESDTSSSSDCD